MLDGVRLVISSSTMIIVIRTISPSGVGKTDHMILFGGMGRII